MSSPKNDHPPGPSDGSPLRLPQGGVRDDALEEPPPAPTPHPCIEQVRLAIQQANSKLSQLQADHEERHLQLCADERRRRERLEIQFKGELYSSENRLLQAETQLRSKVKELGFQNNHLRSMVRELERDVCHLDKEHDRLRAGHRLKEEEIVEVIHMLEAECDQVEHKYDLMARECVLQARTVREVRKTASQAERKHDDLMEQERARQIRNVARRQRRNDVVWRRTQAKVHMMQGVMMLASIALITLHSGVSPDPVVAPAVCMCDHTPVVNSTRPANHTPVVLANPMCPANHTPANHTPVVLANPTCPANS